MPLVLAAVETVWLFGRPSLGLRASASAPPSLAASSEIIALVASASSVFFFFLDVTNERRGGLDGLFGFFVLPFLIVNFTM